MKNILSATLLLTVAASAAAAPAPLWLRDAKISPDGTRIAFTYKGDIFTVPATGGEALRITSQPTYETTPVWSPDSKTLAFASDRYGNFDIFTVAADGSSSQWKRLTFNSASETPEAFTPDGKALLYSASIQDPASSALFPSGRMTELYSVPTSGGAPTQLLATPATNIAWAPDGKSFLYQDVKGFEDTWRKHHTSSVTRDIWRYTPATGKHEPVVSNPGEDLCPVDAGSEIFFISERAPQKSLNIYSAPAGNPEAAKALTAFKKHPVRFLSRAANGTLAFAYDGELYTLTPGGKPAKVNVSLHADFPDETAKLSASRGARGAVASPDGKQVAFAYRGDIYVTSTDYSTTKQICDTPEAEGQISWGNDSTLYYVSERDGRYNIYRATFTKSADEPDFAHATVITEEPVFKADKHERTVPEVSPDGKSLGFILDRNKLCVMDLESRKVRQLTDGWTHRQRNGGFGYRWSPDSKWIALDIVDRRHDPYTDIAIINVADGTLTNITNSGYFDTDARWIMDGNAIAFMTERDGMRNHASWGSQMDVYFVFLNQEAYDRFRMSKEEREIYDAKIKEEKKKADSKEAKDKKDKKDKKNDKAGDDVEPIKVELEGISDRQMRITPMSTDLRDAIVDKEGKTLYYMSSADTGLFVWKLDLEEGDLSMERRHSDPSAYFDITPDGKNIFLLGSTLNKFGSKVKPISFRAEKTLDPAAERAYMFDNIEREERERFYTADMHGVDWPSMSADYRKFLPHINNNYDFAELVSEWLGELNVSHTGGRFYGTSGTDAPERTAALGALYDLTYTGKGARIAEVIAKSPLAAVSPAVRPGAVVEKINGREVTAEMPVDRLLTDAAGKRTLVTVKDADGSRRDIVLRPITASRQSGLLYDRWVKQREHDVDSLSNGRLGYVHISSMDDESFRRVYSNLLGKFNDREGVVIDIRWNGGGRLHEDIEVLLSGEKYFTQEIRGEATCDMPSRRWNKPSIMLMSEACYSNAHGTPWVYKHRGLGKLVGMPVPGTMTSVNWVTMQDPSLVYGIPVVGYRLADGSVLENQQLEPDVKVANNPADIVRGIDTQLRTAVETLLKELK
ncbi:MAG: PDZ domain-containing protein [Muribaculaceae bacterium]|nr:PDZ domain-containing protein [Muribaculaceae bacterium]